MWPKIHERLWEREKKVFVTSKENIERLSRSVNNLLDLLKMESGTLEFKRKKTALRDLLKHAGLLFEPQVKMKGLEFYIHFPEDELYVYANTDRILQVLGYLVDNAIKFTKKGFIEISVIEKEKTVECFVKDTGLGIPSDRLPLILERFQQHLVQKNVKPGLGLGLLLAKGLVNLHQGKIWIKSQEDKGTRVFFTLPKYTSIKG